MNERILELAEQASDAVAGNAFSMARYNEKFAELIVEECLQQIQFVLDNPRYDDHHRLAIEQTALIRARLRIQEQFDLRPQD